MIEYPERISIGAYAPILPGRAREECEGSDARAKMPDCPEPKSVEPGPCRSDSNLPLGASAVRLLELPISGSVVSQKGGPESTPTLRASTKAIVASAGKSLGQITTCIGSPGRHGAKGGQQISRHG